ncbi:MAG: hypothetical protein KJ864_04280 [Candidatus Omnitrophica bacterium]|nr:hypothetical protein [Candidatus Omnitrophota bacterium]
MRNLRMYIFALSGLILVVFVLLVALCVRSCSKATLISKKVIPAKTATLKKETKKSEKPKEIKRDVDQVKAVVPSSAPITEERVYYDFEKDLNGWEIPLWARGKNDYVAKNVTSSNEVAIHGKNSMRVEVNFPGDIWAAALVEIQQYLDLSPYRVVSADIYLPQDAPIGLKARMILTVGNNWKFVEMSRSVPLVPGKWVTLSANIEPGSYDWKRIVPDDKFAEDVRKVAIRVESNRKPEYEGLMYIDNIRCGK